MVSNPSELSTMKAKPKHPIQGTFGSLVLLMIILCIELSTCIKKQRTGQIPRWGWQTLWIDQTRWRMAGANVVVGWCHHGATSSHHHHPLRTSSKDLTSPLSIIFITSIIFSTTIIFSNSKNVGLHSGCFFLCPSHFSVLIYEKLA